MIDKLTSIGRLGEGFSIDENGVISVTGGSSSTFIELTDTPASYGTPGQLIVVNETGDALEFATPNEYTLPIATNLILGGVKVGSGLAIDGDGVISAEVSANHASEHITGGDDIIPDAVASTSSGLLSGVDKAKLDGIAAGANNYSLPTASADTLGGVKIGSGITITDGVISASGGSGDVTGPETTTENKVPQWDSTNKKLKDGLVIGTSALNLVQLDAEGKLPAVDGSNLTNVSTVASFTDLTDCPATLGTSGQVPVVNEAGDALEFATITPVFEAVSVAYTLPESPTNGETIDIVGIGYPWVVTASGDCTIQMGFDSSVINGTLSSTSWYDSVTLVYIGGSKWVVTRPCGVLTLDAE